MHLRLCIHLQTKPLDPLHDTLCKVIHCSTGWCLQNHLQGKPSQFVSLEKCTQCQLSGEKVGLSSWGPSWLLRVSWEWGHSAWMFATHLRRDAGWWQNLKEELGERLLRTQSSMWVFTNSTYHGWRALLILVRGTDNLGKVMAEKPVFTSCALSWARMLSGPHTISAVCWEFPLVWGCMYSKISVRT